MHQMAIKPQTKLETLRSTYTLVFQKRLTTTRVKIDVFMVKPARISNTIPTVTF